MTASALFIVVGLIAGLTGPFDSGPAWGTYTWPVLGPVVREFELPPDPYSSGHRGIDIASPFGTEMVAAQDGVVAFAGWVAGALYVSIDHPDGVRSTYSWVSSATVTAGQVVVRGQPIGSTGHGHPEEAAPHLHFGARVDSTYLDPLLLLERGVVAGMIHLAPLAGDGGGVMPERWHRAGLVEAGGRSSGTADPRGRIGTEQRAFEPGGLRFTAWPANRGRR